MTAEFSSRGADKQAAAGCPVDIIIGIGSGAVLDPSEWLQDIDPLNWCLNRHKRQSRCGGRTGVQPVPDVRAREDAVTASMPAGIASLSHKLQVAFRIETLQNDGGHCAHPRNEWRVNG